MQQVLSFWSALEPSRRVIVAGAAVAMFVAVLSIARLASAPSMSLLYAGLDPAAAGDVVRTLDQRGAAFDVRGDSIWVDSRQRDQLRMALAAEGLPATAGAGYELLDQLSGFGTTSQMFDAAHLRAKEGELARTIVSSPFIRAARVHIAQGPSQPFRRDQPVTASVTVTSAGAGLPPAQARALKFLVASAVAGLSPDDVAVIDTATGLVLTGDGDETTSRAATDRAQDLKRNLERLLAARVGAGRAMVELSLDLVTERESITERRFDPQSRVAISTESEERSDSASGQAAGVTIASNLPEGDAGAGGESRSQSSETRERVNYEVSETQREVQRAPGAVRRLTVAVLVDGIRAPDGTWQPRSDAELADLRELVASATGFDEARGDVITLKTLEFDLPGAEGTPAEASFFSGIDPMALIQLGVAALVALVLGLFVLRPLFAGAGRRAEINAPLALPGAAGGTVLNGEIDEGDNLPPFARVSGDRNAEDGLATEADPVARLRKLIAERQTESVEILRAWMDDREEAK